MVEQSVKVEPFPYSLLAQINPLCCLIISFAMASPKPVPPWRDYVPYPRDKSDQKFVAGPFRNP